MSEPQELPDGYRERMSHSIDVIIEEAGRAMEIVEEFTGDNAVIEGNGIKVTIERIDDD